VESTTPVTIGAVASASDIDGRFAESAAITMRDVSGLGPTCISKHRRSRQTCLLASQPAVRALRAV
jgi:hypothetical protein